MNSILKKVIITIIVILITAIPCGFWALSVYYDEALSFNEKLELWGLLSLAYIIVTVPICAFIIENKP